MEDNQKDKIVELSISKEGFKIKLQNTKEGAIAKIGETIVDSLSFFRWNRAVRMYDKYNEKKNARKIGDHAVKRNTKKNVRKNVDQTAKKNANMNVNHATIREKITKKTKLILKIF